MAPRISFLIGPRRTGTSRGPNHVRDERGGGARDADAETVKRSSATPAVWVVEKLGEVVALSDAGKGRRQHLLWVLSAATFLIFFQAFLVAPLLPRLAELFGVPVETVGLIVPAYLIPYGAATLAYGPLSDRFGRGRLILASLLAFVVLTAVTAAPGRRRACSCSAS